MHELSVARALVQLIETEARRAGARRVRTARVVLGARSHLSPETLRFYVAHLVDPAGPAADLVLEFERRPMRLHCLPCQRDYEPTETDWCCPTCGRIGALKEAGDEVYLESLEIECAPQPTD
ncbi:hydrogenase maturation nickel metallochaperone HypA/HybF [Rhodothermus profundi]|uniref:Hydrogenase maturation factor HypA n=1 Tax=Rhodothermus profundi TaxID=633813 RepID=A0A1M6RK96_9BACT|nr:hydrogenase maturation nickel metallochaperone HypA [Rhodothermus profundi]SHK32757.1 hydrogenase nickel incorporation protein HypA/HybF [Rhodothermus profundi]